MSDQQSTSQATGDIWKQWLLHRRNPTDESKTRTDEHMRGVRDEVLDNARIEEGDTLLDVGTGTGLIAFGALERVGEKGRVIFSDISADCLDHCRSFAGELGALDRCEFIEAAIEDLSAIPDSSVDVVTTRSVLIYSSEKQRAFHEFYRVLKPGGRLSMFEPINRFGFKVKPGTYAGYDVMPIKELMMKVQAVREAHQPVEGSTLLDFDERDLFTFTETAGFTQTYLELKASVVQGRRAEWDLFYHAAPNPLALSLEEAAQRALTEEERERFVEYLRTTVETTVTMHRQALAYLVAIKGETLTIS